MAAQGSTAPLLHQPDATPSDLALREQQIYEDHMAGRHDHYSFLSPYSPSPVLVKARRHVQRFQTSKFGHYTILLLVALDVSAIFTDLFITLYLCDHKDAIGWMQFQEVLGTVGLVFSCLFAVELLLSVWAFGPGQVYTFSASMKMPNLTKLLDTSNLNFGCLIQ
jgi:hypothetical protein